MRLTIGASKPKAGSNAAIKFGILPEGITGRFLLRVAIEMHVSVLLECNAHSSSHEGSFSLSPKKEVNVEPSNALCRPPKATPEVASGAPDRAYADDTYLKCRPQQYHLRRDSCTSFINDKRNNMFSDTYVHPQTFQRQSATAPQPSRQPSRPHTLLRRATEPQVSLDQRHSQPHPTLPYSQHETYLTNKIIPTQSDRSRYRYMTDSPSRKSSAVQAITVRPALPNVRGAASQPRAAGSGARPGTQENLRGLVPRFSAPEARLHGPARGTSARGFEIGR